MGQDLPPSGGYEPIQYKRNIPARGFRPVYYLIGMGAIMTYGFYKYGVGVREHKYDAPASQLHTKGIKGPNPIYARLHGDKADTDIDSELAREKMWARIHLIPLLQAEEDRDQVRRHWAEQARERELMGVETKVYNSDRFVRPTYAVTPQREYLPEQYVSDEAKLKRA